MGGIYLNTKFAACILLMSLMMCACAARADAPTLLIEQRSTVSTPDGSDVTEYFHDRVILHGAIYEVQGRKAAGGVESRMRWLYAADGTPLGSRTYDGASVSDSLSYLYWLDGDFDTYVAWLSDVERIDGNTIYFTDSSCEEVTVEDGVIRRTVRRYADGSSLEMRLTRYGQLEALMLCSAGEGAPDTDIKIEYAELDPSELAEAAGSGLFS